MFCLALWAIQSCWRALTAETRRMRTQTRSTSGRLLRCLPVCGCALRVRYGRAGLGPRSVLRSIPRETSPFRACQIPHVRGRNSRRQRRTEAPILCAQLVRTQILTAPCSRQKLETSETTHRGLDPTPACTPNPARAAPRPGWPRTDDPLPRPSCLGPSPFRAPSANVCTSFLRALPAATLPRALGTERAADNGPCAACLGTSYRTTRRRARANC